MGLSFLTSKRSRSRRGAGGSRRSGSGGGGGGSAAQQVRKAQARRAEAIALLEWVSFGHVAPDYAALLQQADSLRPSSADREHDDKVSLHFLAQQALAKALNRNQSHIAFRTSTQPLPAPSETPDEQSRNSALWVLAEHSLWGTHAAAPHLPRAKAAYEVLAWSFGNATAHARLGFLEGSGWGRIGGPGVGSGKAWGVGFGAGAVETEAEEGLRQARALLHYELAASAPEPARPETQSQSRPSAKGLPQREQPASASPQYSSRSSAQMALGFRYLSGIGTPMDCMKALEWYETASHDAYARFISGPPKGLTLPYTHLRLSDVEGGAYGPGASAASSGYAAASRPQIQAALESRPGSGAVGEEARIRDLLEYYEYQAEPLLKSSGAKGNNDPKRAKSSLGKKFAAAGGELSGEGGGVRSTANAAKFAIELARFYYGGSLWDAGESAGRVERDFVRAREYARRVAERVWPLDAGEVRRGGPSGMPPRAAVQSQSEQQQGGTKGKGGSASGGSSGSSSSSTGAGAMGSKQLLEGEDLTLKVTDHSLLYANKAASMLGWIYLRGEGVKQDYARAWVWFARGSDMGDPDCHNGLGVMIRDGYGVKPNIEDAARYFKGASLPQNPRAEGLVNMGKIFYEAKDYNGAIRSMKGAMSLMDPFESYFWHAKADTDLVRVQALASAMGETSTALSGPSVQERCDSAVLNFKQAVERADWADPVFHRADRAWRRGDTQRALLGWMLAGEMGYESAQNNVAWIMDRDKHRLQIPSLDSPPDTSFDRLALVQWTRSAGQENVDALVKMGDYYFRGIGTSTPGVPSYEKAVACYSAAADMSASALAYWNMGWMYETGLGVGQRDFHLAKRYYDMAWNTNRREAYLAVAISLAKLHVRAAWAAIVHGDASALAMFDSYARGLDNSMPLTEAEEEKAKKQALKAQQQRTSDKADGGLAKDVVEDDEPGAGDPYIPETYDRRTPQERLQDPQQQQPEQYDSYNEGDHDAYYGDGHDRHFDYDDGEAAGGLTADIFDDFEGLLLILAMGFLGFLVWYRQRIQNAPVPAGGQQPALTPAERERRERIEAAREEFRARGEEVIMPPADDADLAPAAQQEAQLDEDDAVIVAEAEADAAVAEEERLGDDDAGREEEGDGGGGAWAERRHNEEHQDDENDPALFDNAM
ncbi:hypothetical protein V8E36_002355 [Tilletia maclaganii]